jgi:hypothetical protein
MANPKKSDTRPATAGKKKSGPDPNDDPLAEVSAAAVIDYDYAFDAAGLVEDVRRGPTAAAAIEVLSAEVMVSMAEDSADRIRKVDPSFVAAIALVIRSIVEACPPEEVGAALSECSDRPRSLRTKAIRFGLARRLPGHWGSDALEAARAIIATAVENMARGTEVVATLYPAAVPAPEPEPGPAPEPAPTPTPDQVVPDQAPGPDAYVAGDQGQAPA